MNNITTSLVQHHHSWINRPPLSSTMQTSRNLKN